MVFKEARKVKYNYGGWDFMTVYYVYVSGRGSVGISSGSLLDVTYGFNTSTTSILYIPYNFIATLKDGREIYARCTAYNSGIHCTH